MTQKQSKSKTEKEIKEFFSNIKNKSPKEIKKIKKLAMNHNIPLKELRKTFCKKCFIPYINPKIKIKKRLKIITCEKCNYNVRIKLK